MAYRPGQPAVNRPAADMSRRHAQLPPSSRLAREHQRNILAAEAE
jgi:hypothetical protein